MIRVYIFERQNDSHVSYMQESWRMYCHDENINMDMPEVIKLSGGKPVFSNKTFSVSISHSGNVWACSIGRCNIGMDIEVVGRGDYKRIPSRFFAEYEENCINRSDNKPKTFSQIWNRKEAYVKYTGNGIAKEFSEFSTCGEDGIWQCPEGCYIEQNNSISIGTVQYVCSVCSPRKETICYRIIKLKPISQQ